MKITVNKLNYLLARHLDKQGEEMNIEKVEKDIKEILEGGLISEGEDGVYGIDNSSLSDADEKIIGLAKKLSQYVVDKQIKELTDYCDWLEKSNYEFFETVQSHLSNRIVELKAKEVENICETAPYPSCNGANGCDTCEHQEED